VGKPISKTYLATKLDISRARLYQLIDQGMPTISFEKAQAWRQGHASQRAPVNKAEAKAPGKANGRKRITPTIAPSKTGDSLLDAMNNAIYIADRAFEEYHLACDEDSTNRSARLSEHNKALDARLKAEKAYREELERRNILVNKNTMAEKTRRCMEAIMRRLRKLPSECGPQCNEQDSIRSVNILQNAVDEILTAGQQALHDL
jgi:hypothetical protein